MNFRAYLYLTSIGIAGFYVALNQSLNLNFEKFAFALFILSISSFFAEIYELEILPRWRLSTATAIDLAAVYVGGASLGILVVLFSTLPAEVLLRWGMLKDSFWDFLSRIVFNTGQLILSVAAAAYILEIAERYTSPYYSIRGFFPLIVAFFAYVIVNNSLVSIIVSIVSKRKFTYILRFGLKNLHLQFLTMGVLAILMAILYSTSQWNLILAIIPLALVHYSMRSYIRLRRNSHTAFTHIADLMEKRDKYTGKHSQDVVDLAIKLVMALELSDEQIEIVRMGAAIHDIGKIAVPDAILNKPGPLNEQEREIMKQHPVVGAEIIGDLEIYRDVVPIVRHEHEHWNGQGYPDGLKGEGIPLGARIVAVADVYSALTTERNYRPSQGKPLKYTPQEACDILKEMAESVLDPELVDVFINKAIGNLEDH